MKKYLLYICILTNLYLDLTCNLLMVIFMSLPPKPGSVIRMCNRQNNAPDISLELIFEIPLTNGVFIITFQIYSPHITIHSSYLNDIPNPLDKTKLDASNMDTHICPL